MSGRLLLLSILLVQVLASTAEAVARCEDHYSFLTTKLKAARPHAEILRTLNIKSRRLVLVGEYHWNYDFNSLADLFLGINENFGSAPKRRCLFVEMVTNATAGSDQQFWSGKIETHPFLDLAPSSQGWNANDADSAAYYALFLMANKHGYKFIHVDTDPSGGNGRSLNMVTSKGMDLRNQFMAKSINAHFAKGTCEQGVYFVGKAHIANDETLKPFVRTLPSRLRELGFTMMTTINLQTLRLKFAGQKPNIDPFLVPQACQDQLATVPFMAGVGFLNSWNKLIPLVETITERWLWNRFDATLLVD